MWLSLNIIVASCGYLQISFYKAVISKYYANVVISEYHPGIMWLSQNIILQGGYL